MGRGEDPIRLETSARAAWADNPSAVTFILCLAAARRGVQIDRRLGPPGK